MTFFDVLDDAVKIGLGGFIAWIISRTTRSHEFEKERRRRKQDCLEQVIEDLGEQEAAFDNWCSQCNAYRTVKDKEGSPAVLQKLLDNIIEHHAISQAARAKLIRSHSKLIVFGFAECAASLQAYHHKLLNFNMVVHAVREGTKEREAYTSGRVELGKTTENFREAVSKAFQNL